MSDRLSEAATAAHEAMCDCRVSTHMNVEMYDRSLRHTRTIVAGTRREQFSHPTPCTDWDVQTLLNHIIGGCTTFAAGARGTSVNAMQGGSFTDGDYVDSFERAAAEAIQGFRSPGAMDRKFTLPWGETPAQVAPGLALADAVVHGWDLAVATGQRLQIDDDIAEALYQMTSSMMEPLGSFPRMTSFKDPVPIDAGAPPADRLLAYLGRDPSSGKRSSEHV